MKTRSIGIASALSLLALAATGLPTASAAPQQPQPGAAAVRYLVRTDSAPTVGALAADVRRSGGTVEHVYERVVNGFSAELTPAQAAALRTDSDVTSVTRDTRVSLATTQKKPTWGLDRIDQRGAKGSQSYNYDRTGAGVTAFVVDTGVRLTHTQFGGRATSGYDFVDADTNASDCNGHGTHVAGTIGGSTYGVAKGVKIVSVRVLDCEGSGWLSDVIDGLDWAVAHKPAGPAVVNMSIGGTADEWLNEAVDSTVGAGIPVVVAAGNENDDACWSSPASAPRAITVAATDDTDHRSWFSNYGRCVDIFAPGQDVLSAANKSNTATEYLSGTSMATPHVVGVVARYLQTHPKSTPAQTSTAVLAAATSRAVSDAAGSPNRLLYAAPTTVAPGLPTKVVASKSDAKKTGTLTWSVPTTDGGSVITGYRVTRDGQGDAGASPATVTVSASTRSHTFTKLKKGSAYTFTVRAVNAVGAGGAVTQKIAKLT